MGALSLRALIAETMRAGLRLATVCGHIQVGNNVRFGSLAPNGTSAVKEDNSAMAMWQELDSAGVFGSHGRGNAENGTSATGEDMSAMAMWQELDSAGVFGNHGRGEDKKDISAVGEGMSAMAMWQELDSAGVFGSHGRGEDKKDTSAIGEDMSAMAMWQELDSAGVFGRNGQEQQKTIIVAEVPNGRGAPRRAEDFQMPNEGLLSGKGSVNEASPESAREDWSYSDSWLVLDDQAHQHQRLQLGNDKDFE